jgi:hypothetical protein
MANKRGRKKKPGPKKKRKKVVNKIKVLPNNIRIRSKKRKYFKYKVNRKKIQKADIFSINSIADYIFCPMSYKYKHHMKISDIDNSITSLYSNAIKRFIMREIEILISTESKESSLTSKALKWQLQWEKISEKYDSKASLEYQSLGLMAIKYFADMCNEDNIFLCVNYPFSLNLGNFIIRDYIDLIYLQNYKSNNDKVINFIRMSNEINGGKPALIDNCIPIITYNMSNSILSKVFNFKNTKYRYMLYDPFKNKLFSTLKRKETYNLYHTYRMYLSSIVDAIRFDMFYPRVSTSSCGVCGYNNFCDIKHSMGIQYKKEIDTINRIKKYQSIDDIVDGETKK